MCLDTNETFDGHKTLVCQVGDLKLGDQYRTPEGETRIMTDGTTGMDGYSLVVCLETGKVHNVNNSIKLGTDRRGRLYASRSLNPTTPKADPVQDSLDADLAAHIALEQQLEDDGE